MRAFSLLETMVSLGLSALILVIAGRIFSDYYKLSRSAQQRSQVVDASLSGMRWVASRLRRAERWVQPLPLGEASGVTWTEREDTPQQWLQLESGGWSPVPASRRLRVVIEEEQLWCIQGDTRHVLASGVSDWRVRRPRSEHIELELRSLAVRSSPPLKATVLKP